MVRRQVRTRKSQGVQLNSLEFTTLIFAGSLLAGFLGALTGLGGGVVVIPLLTVIFGVDIDRDDPGGDGEVIFHGQWKGQR